MVLVGEKRAPSSLGYATSSPRKNDWMGKARKAKYSSYKGMSDWVDVAKQPERTSRSLEMGACC